MKSRALFFIFLVFTSFSAFAENCNEFLLYVTTPSSERPLEPIGSMNLDTLQPDEIRENKVAEDLGLFGFDVVQNPFIESLSFPIREFYDAVMREDLEYSRHPDLMIEGKIFDVYYPMPDTGLIGILRKSANKVSRAQTRRVIIDLRRNNRFKEGQITLLDFQQGTTEWAGKKPEEVMILHGSEEKPQLTRVFPDMEEFKIK